MESKLVVVDKGLVDARRWKGNKLYIYALDRSTIGVSPKVVDEWEECALFRARVSCLETTTTVAFELPKRLRNFYLLDQPATKLVVSGQRTVVLLTVS